MDGRDFLKVAKSLMQGTEEAQYRSAVSRAYYATHIFARQLLENWEFRVSKGPAAHGEVVNKFQACGNLDVQKAASKLNALHGRRIDADYLRKDDIGRKETATLWVKISEEIVQTLETCEEDPRKSEVIRGMKSYDERTKGTP